MEVSGDISTRLSLDVTPLFFHMVSKPFLKQLLDLGFDGVVRWKLPASEMFFSVFKKRESPKVGRRWAVRWVGRGPEMASAAGRLLLPPGLGKSDRLL
jgi:hypothetical protein